MPVPFPTMKVPEVVPTVVGVPVMTPVMAVSDKPVKGKAWTRNKNTAGNASYTSFVNDTLIHRVSNCDTVPFHVTDIEILSAYKPTASLAPLPFTVLFNNEKAIAYRLSGQPSTGSL